MTDHASQSTSEPLAPSSQQTRLNTNEGVAANSDAEDVLPEPAEKPPDVDVPPNGGYGWVCVACTATINAHSWGINSTYAVFLSYYLTNDYFPDTSPLTYAFIGGLSISMAMLIAPIATIIVRSFGTRVCLHIGVFFETASFIGSSFAHSKWQIILSQGICFGWGMGFLFVGSVGVISQWFTTRRSLANAVGAAGSGLGAMTYSLASQKIISTLGLPWAFRILGICVFAVNLTCANLIRDRNKAVGSRHRAFDTSMLRRPEFLLLQGWSWFSMLGYVIVLFSLPSYGTSVGLTAQQGSALAAILNVGQAVGRPFIGLASDRFGRINVAASMTFLEGLLILAFWIPASAVSNPYGLLIFFALVGGGPLGCFWATISAVAAEVCGLRDLPGALSWTWLLMVPPTTFAEPIALEMRDPGSASGGWEYLPPQLFTAAMYIGGAACLWVVRAWKVGELEEVERLKKRDEERSEVTLDEKLGNGRGELQNDGRKAQDENLHRSDGDRTVNREVALDAKTAAWKPKDLMRRMFVWRVV